MQCLICNHKAQEYLDTFLDIKTYQCSYCTYIFKSPEIFSTLKEQKIRYDLHQNDPSDLGYKKYFQGFIDYVLPLTPDIRNALDFGCGKSTLLSNMMQNIGIDSQYYDPIYHPSNKYYEGKYDLITSVEVFEHLHHPAQTFEQLLSMLNSRGFLAIKTEFAPKNMQEYFEWYYRQDPTHIGFFNKTVFEYLSSKFDCKYIDNNTKNISVFALP